MISLEAGCVLSEDRGVPLRLEGDAHMEHLIPRAEEEGGGCSEESPRSPASVGSPGSYFGSA